MTVSCVVSVGSGISPSEPLGLVDAGERRGGEGRERGSEGNCSYMCVRVCRGISTSVRSGGQGGYTLHVYGKGAQVITLDIDTPKGKPYLTYCPVTHANYQLTVIFSGYRYVLMEFVSKCTRSDFRAYQNRMS